MFCHDPEVVGSDFSSVNRVGICVLNQKYNYYFNINLTFFNYCENDMLFCLALAGAVMIYICTFCHWYFILTSGLGQLINLIINFCKLTVKIIIFYLNSLCHILG